MVRVFRGRMARPAEAGQRCQRKTQNEPAPGVRAPDDIHDLTAPDSLVFVLSFMSRSLVWAL